MPDLVGEMAAPAGLGAGAVVMEKIGAPTLWRLGEIEDVGDQVAVEVAVAIIVGENRMHGGVLDIEPVGLGAFREGAIVIIEVEQIRGVITADIDIGPAVLVDVHHRGAGLAGAFLVAGHAGRGGHIDKLERRGLAVERARAVFRDREYPRPAIVEEIPHRDAGLDRAEGEFAKTGTPHAGIIEDVGHVHASLNGREDRKCLGAGGRGRARQQWRGRKVGGEGKRSRAKQCGGGERGFEHDVRRG